MEPREQHSPEEARQKAVAELTKSGANPPEGFNSLEEALASLEKAGDTVSGKMKDGIGEWSVTRGATEADFNIQSGGEYDKTEAA